MCWECYSCVKACPQNAIDARGYTDFAPLGHSVRVLREEEKGTISWKIKFRNGTEKNFESPITTQPWGEKIPKLADLEVPSQDDLDSQLLCFEPDALNVETGLPVINKDKLKEGVYY
jgi:adenylylsulfate reductase subunit B